jgi:hypothetical protein
MAVRVPPHPCENESCETITSNLRCCSNACHLIRTQEQRAASRRRPRLCPWCGIGHVMRGAIHCSRICSDEARRVVADPCRRCGSAERTGRRRGGPYCSWACWNEDRYESTGGFAKWVAAWVAGDESGTTPEGKPDLRVRQALVFLRGQRCEECGWAKINPVSQRVPLHADHITGDRSKNRPEDVRLLCPNCHSLTPTYQYLNNPKVTPIRKNAGRRYREIWIYNKKGQVGG